MSDISQIDGHSVRLKRESFGWAISDMATMACLSSKQIKQIEEGGLAAFYSEGVKLTAAKKVAALLQMTEAELFGQVAPPVLVKPVDDVVASAESQEDGVPTVPSDASQTSVHGAALSRSESWHFLAQPPENILEQESQSPAQVQVVTPEPDHSEKSEPADAASEEIPAQVVSEPANNTNYLIKILTLFLVALAAAALLKQNYSDDKAESSPAIESQTTPALNTQAPAAETDTPNPVNAQALSPEPVNAVQASPVATETGKPNAPVQASTPTQPVTEAPGSATAK
jgi:DNA-binding XRE family transcriptional regulator